jgi:DNA repair and recombination RAD54-like protein
MTIAYLTSLHRRHREKVRPSFRADEDLPNTAGFVLTKTALFFRSFQHFVVVCPSSLVTNWANEFDKWLGLASQPKRVVIHKGGEEGLQQIRAYTQKMKHQLMHQPGQVLIVSYELFRRNSDEFVFPDNVSVGLLVVDEGHRLKNTSGSLTLEALESLPSDARMCITATPIQNNLCEFYKLANFCCPGILGADVASFRKNYERPIAAANQKNASPDILAAGLAKSRELETVSKTFMLRRLQKDVLKTMLPPRTEALLFCRPSALQRQLYRSLTSHAVTDGNTADALTTLTALRKICSHPFLHDTTNNDRDSDATTDLSVTLSGKLVVLDALLEQIRKEACSDKVVIVSNFTQALSIIESLILQPRKLSYLRLDGSTQNRQVLVDTFNRTSPESNFCLLLSSKAGGCGLNIAGANRLVMFGKLNANDLVAQNCIAHNEMMAHSLISP